MRNVGLAVLVVPLMLAFNPAGFAGDNNTVDADDVTMSVVKNERSFKGGKGKEMRRLVSDYMLKNGDITKAEIDAMVKVRKATRKELKALRASGDEAALAARLEQLRTVRMAKREEMRKYVASHEDLAAAIKAKRAKMGKRKGGHKPCADKDR